MEQKLKTEIYTENKLFKDTAEIPVDVDFLLPDYCPDVVKILKCRAVARIASRTVSGGSVSPEGSVTISVLYSDENNRVFSFEQPFPFAKSFETGITSDNASVDCRARVEYMNCRAVTGRKIDIHGAVELTLCVCERQTVEILADYDDPQLELRRNTVPATTPMGTAQKYVVLEDVITVGQGQPDICALLRYDAEPTVRESKLLNGKNIVKGELCLRMLYAPTEGKPQTVRAILPFSQLIEVPGATEECTCDAEVCVAALEIKPKTEPGGEIRNFAVNAKLLICSKAYCDKDLEVITDAYSRKFETALTPTEVEIRRLDRVMEESCRCRSVFDFPNGTPTEVLDLCCEVQNAAASFGETELTVSGTVMAGLLVCGENGIPEYYEKPVEFSCKYPCEMTENASCVPVVTVRNCNYSLDRDGHAEIRIELAIRAPIMITNPCRLITDLQVDEQPLPAEDRGAMTLYFAAAGESVWDIARRYRAAVEEIRSLNQIGDVLNEDCMLMIPMS